LGIAPIRALAEQAVRTRPGTPVVVVHRCRTTGLVEREWAELVARSGGWLAVHERIGPREQPGNQINVQTLSEVAPWLDQAEIIAVGTPEFTEAVREVAETVGSRSIRTESFGW
jgi:ferredoxin-NADP reductase